MSKRRSVPSVEQLQLFRPRGGLRKEAGRKPKGPRPMVSHAARPALSSRHPVQITTRLCSGLPSLRNPEVRGVLLRAIAAGSSRPGFRLVHHSIQSNHLHAIVEAQDANALSRGVQGLLVRIARALNKHWQRKGRVFLDRFHALILSTPWTVRNSLVYVLQNARKHNDLAPTLDPFSSARWFDGWEAPPVVDSGSRDERPVVPARTWLMRVGWRKHGEIDLLERPALAKARRRSGA